MKTVCVFLAVMLSMAASVSFVSAQAWRGVVRGRVLDASGARVAGAQIGIRHAATGVTRDVITAADGEFSIPELSPGRYTLEARATGHKTWRRDLDLSIHQE